MSKVVLAVRGIAVMLVVASCGATPPEPVTAPKPPPTSTASVQPSAAPPPTPSAETTTTPAPAPAPTLSTADAAAKCPGLADGLRSLPLDEPSTERAATHARAVCGQACDGGQAVGCSYLAWMLAKGIHVDEDPRAAVELRAKACDLGEVPSCVHAGLAYGFGNGVDADPKRAAAYYAKACDGGEPLGCHNLGAMHERGDAVTKSASKAAALYRRACEAKPSPFGGKVSGCTSLAELLLDGDGIAQDEASAHKLFRDGCIISSDGAACYMLGWLHETGRIAARNPARARELYEKACGGAAGDGRACLALARLSKDDAGAIFWLTRGCSQWDSGEACAKLADRYARGRGVPRDDAMARKHYRLACDYGETTACAKAN